MTHDAQEMMASFSWQCCCLPCSYVQGLVYRTEGAVGVALVNAIRGGTVSLMTGALFCRSATPNRCLSVWTACSAAVETAGGVTWLTATHKVETLFATLLAASIT